MTPAEERRYVTRAWVAVFAPGAAFWVVVIAVLVRAFGGGW